MRTAGIICEYNPFHLGHQKQIDLTRAELGADTGIVCLMSGNYVQRGEPAVFDKWSRAESAVKGGADLVLELPITTAVNAGGYFASGAVRYMDALGGIDYMSFGSECGDLAKLKQTAELLMSSRFEEEMAKSLSTGVSYATARSKALSSLGGDGTLLEKANNALGVDYLRALLELGSKIEPITVKRDMSLLSASAIREGMGEEGWTDHIPEDECIESLPKHTLKNGERAILGILRTLPDAAFEAMAFGSEGLWSKFMKAARKESSVEEILMGTKSKRYAYSRLRRMLMCLVLGLGEKEMGMGSPYLRVLAFNDRGRQLLRQLSEKSALPLISGAIPKTPEAKAYFALEQRATDLYGLFAPEGETPSCGLEKSTPPRIV